MQLFISTYKKKADTVIVENAEILSQVRKVLRAKIGDTIWIQDPVNEAEKIRYEIRIDDWDDKTLQGTILSETPHHVDPENITMIIAMPNKWDRAELIIQKLSEIGIGHIIFWPSERSVIKERNSKKEERMQKILKEAVEQSRGRTMPKLAFTTDLKEYLTNTEVIVFDKNKNEENRQTSRNIEKEASPSKVEDLSSKVGIVGPEGGLTAKDYQQREAYSPKIVGLGETVLRMETAAIIGARLLNNSAKF